MEQVGVSCGTFFRGVYSLSFVLFQGPRFCLAVFVGNIVRRVSVAAVDGFFHRVLFSCCQLCLMAARLLKVFL